MAYNKAFSHSKKPGKVVISNPLCLLPHYSTAVLFFSCTDKITLF